MKKFDKNGERMPFPEKYTPQETDYDGLVVSPTLANKLKKAGFHENVNNFYEYIDRVPYLSRYDAPTDTNAYGRDDLVSAPTIYQAKSWLAKHDVIINVFAKTDDVEVSNGFKTFKVKKMNGKWCRSIYTNETYGDNAGFFRAKSPITDFEKEEYALSIAIREGVNIVTTKAKKESN